MQIEAVGHNYLGTFFASADALLAPGGVMVMQAITTPENRYEEYIGSTDFINTIIFPGEIILGAVYYYLPSFLVYFFFDITHLRPRISQMFTCMVWCVGGKGSEVRAGSKDP